MLSLKIITREAEAPQLKNMRLQYRKQLIMEALPGSDVLGGDVVCLTLFLQDGLLRDFVQPLDGSLLPATR